MLTEQAVKLLDVELVIVGSTAIMMEAEDYAAMVTGELNAINAFMTGKVRVEGDLNTVMKFQSIFM